MEIFDARFIVSNTGYLKCPVPDIPEFAFIGRSNVGKSSLINMLAGRKNLAKISGTPGKTRLINHFIINNSWYLVDLPGYGFAKISKSVRIKWEKMSQDYLLHRVNLINTFILIDSRLTPQKSDLEFISWFGEKNLPFVLIFTKSDKLSKSKLNSNLENYKSILLEYWEEAPVSVVTSARTGKGKDEILTMIAAMNKKMAI
jgi:GTP-binding protein